MKKLINCALVFAAVLFTDSCQQEYLESDNGLSTVTFTMELPDYAVTKGTVVVSNINNLIYAIYKTNENNLNDARKSISADNLVNCVNPLAKDQTAYTTFVDGKANVCIELFNDQKYIILFWAQVGQTWVQGTEFDLTQITYPSDLVANSEDYAAFYGAAFVENVKESRSEPLELLRPFAQINIAAENPGFPVTLNSSKVKVTGAGKYFNVATGVVSENMDVTFETAANPAGAFSAAYPNYLASNYVFANGNVSVEYEINANLGTISTFNEPITNVPVQRNYKTNIVGNLLSSEINYSVSLSDGWAIPDTEWVLASSNDELIEAVKVGGNIKLTDDIQIQNTLDVKAGVDVLLDLNGKNIRIDADEFKPNSNGSQYAFIIRDGGSLEICGDGTVETSTPAPIMFYPAGNLVIKSGTFIRHIPEGYNGEAKSMFVGTKPVGGWESTGVTIHGGYFDSGYYDKKAADIEAYLNESKPLEETEDDIAKRGLPGDKNIIRVALKNNIQKMFNRSDNYFHIYGGTFVGANPSWGDEGCMLPTTPQYLRPWSYYQGALLDGQTFHEDGIVLPDGYTISQSTHADGRPIYTVEYTEPESDATTPELPNE